MRIQILTFCAAGALLSAQLFSQCAPPTFRGPEGPRPSSPGNGIPGPDTGNPIPGGDNGRPNPVTDPVGGPSTDPKRGPTTPRGGVPIPLTRGKSAKKRHTIQWQWPKPKAADSENSLDYETALAEVRGDDPRPLLILREGSQYGRGYDKLLGKKFQNESIALLTRWFHCVRFSEAIIQESHPWHAIFSGDYPPQCFVVSWDGHTNEPISGIFSIGRIQGAMKKVIRVEYKKDIKRALRDWTRVLDQLDTIDAQEGNLRQRIEAAAIEHGEKSSKVKRLRSRLAKITRDRRVAEKRELAVLDLQLKRKVMATQKSKLLERIRGTR